MKYITTSWDDGHPLDFKLAELLIKYNLSATFYIPQSNAEREVMKATDVQKLSAKFEIGAHTLHHTRLNADNKIQAQEEIGGSFNWLKDLLGYNPVCFCFPGGKYDNNLIDTVFENGFRLARTTELLHKQQTSKSNVLHTTLQVYDHSGFTYAKHLIKHKRFNTLIQFLLSNSSYSILSLTENFLRNMKDGESFHLWGHSWEIEENNLWKKLEDVLRLIAHNTQFTYVSNKELLTQ